MKKRPKKRYYSKEHILRDIDAANARVLKLMKEAEEMDRAADIMFETDVLYESAKFRRIKASDLRRSAARIRDKRIKRLKEKLAEIQTLELPGIESPDQSISA